MMFFKRGGSKWIYKTVMLVATVAAAVFAFPGPFRGWEDSGRKRPVKSMQPTPPVQPTRQVQSARQVRLAQPELALVMGSDGRQPEEPDPRFWPTAPFRPQPYAPPERLWFFGTQAPAVRRWERGPDAPARPSERVPSPCRLPVARLPQRH